MKTYIRNLALGIILLNFSSCMDFDLNLDSGYGYSTSAPSYTPPYVASFFIDSVTQLTDSTAKIWSHFRFDGQVTLTKRITRVTTADQGVIVFSEDQPINVDINFAILPDSVMNSTYHRMENIYKCQQIVSGLKKDVTYNTCVTYQYAAWVNQRPVTTCRTFRLN